MNSNIPLSCFFHLNLLLNAICEHFLTSFYLWVHGRPQGGARGALAPPPRPLKKVCGRPCLSIFDHFSHDVSLFFQWSLTFPLSSKAFLFQQIFKKKPNLAISCFKKTKFSNKKKVKFDKINEINFEISKNVCFAQILLK